MAAWAIDALQWRGALRALALGVLAGGLAATLLLRRAPLATAAKGARPPGSTLAEALRDARFWCL